jgi:lipopolysaccharide/colanic/teichoic acid biosynthesis glycosyltransferase
MNKKLIRIFDITLSLGGFVIASPVMLLILILGILDTGKPVFRQVRIGLNQEEFVLFKFRTMKIETESVASHLANKKDITFLGRTLRRTKLDELPQLWNVLKGDMSLVGPRPCLPNQTELINERLLLDIFRARPGITGLAQLNGIDMSTPKLLAETESIMLSTLCARDYFYYILQTIFGAGRGDRVRD